MASLSPSFRVNCMYVRISLSTDKVFVILVFHRVTWLANTLKKIASHLEEPSCTDSLVETHFQVDLKPICAITHCTDTSYFQYQSHLLACASPEHTTRPTHNNTRQPTTPSIRQYWLQNFVYLNLVFAWQKFVHLKLLCALICVVQCTCMSSGMRNVRISAKFPDTTTILKSSFL